MKKNNVSEYSQIILINEHVKDEKKIMEKVLLGNICYNNFIIYLKEKYNALELEDDEFDEDEYTHLGDYGLWVESNCGVIFLKSSESKIIELIDDYEKFGGKVFTERDKNKNIVCCVFSPLCSEYYFSNDVTKKLYNSLISLKNY